MPKLLFLEDEPIIAMDLEAVLSQAGFDVHWFTTCRSASYWLENNQPDVALIDIELSDGTCVPIAELLIKRQIPFVVHSGYSSHANYVHEVFKRGRWISKPADYNGLVRILQEHVTTPEQKI
ncbi:response regulator [Pararhizobium sp.]|uniref:response regulator n=1 Tax=Pararhizobium sp. TaxID=1977563 RepID=UPI0027197BD5|nr:response regulator [Pararhizobium sp.]MDO9418492.1 response regulator [Pararhizobium sp.]